MTTPVNHHLVSAGYQRNFADEQRRLVIVNARSGERAPRLRPVRSNWVEEHWNSVIDQRTGQPNTSMEEGFSKIETTVLHRIKTVRIGSVTPEQAGAIVNLFAVHLARSRSFRQWQLKVHDESIDGLVREVAGSDRAIAVFETQYGRPPAPGELEAIAQAVAESNTVSGQWNVEGIARHHDRVVDKLHTLRLQVIEVAESLPGLVIGDVPVVHAHMATGRFGYRDHLAFGDADLIVGPLTRRVAVCFTHDYERSVKVTTKKLLNWLIGIFVRAALTEVACHPDDALNLQRVCRDLPPLTRRERRPTRLPLARHNRQGSRCHAVGGVRTGNVPSDPNLLPLPAAEGSAPTAPIIPRRRALERRLGRVHIRLVCCFEPRMEDDQMPVEDSTAVIQRIVAAANTNDLRAVDQLFAPDYLDHDPGRNELPPGPEGVRQAWAMLRAAFPDVRVTVFDTVAEGDVVAVRGELRGTHRGEQLGLPPTGRAVSVGFMDFNRISGGRVHERWGQLDMLSLLQQLGAVPRPPLSEDAGQAVNTTLPPLSAVAASSPAANKALAHRYAEVVLCGHDLDAAGDFLAPGFVGHIAGVPGVVDGIDAYRAMFGAFLAAFPDYSETIHDVVADGELVASRVTFGGTHRGELFGVPPTGKPVAAQGMAFLRFADNKIIELWTEGDLLGLLTQLGVALGLADHDAG